MKFLEVEKLVFRKYKRICHMVVWYKSGICIDEGCDK